MTIGGDSVKKVTIESYDTVYALKQRLALKQGVRHKLIYDTAVLEDHRHISEYGLSPGATLQLVRLGPSGLAWSLQEMRQCVSPEDSISAALFELVDPVMKAQHVQSERCRPDPQEMSIALNRIRRGELICWLLQAFDVLRFDDQLLHMTILTLDRYCASVGRQGRQLDDTELQRVVLAAAGAEMKVSSADEFPLRQWQRVLTHLCQGMVSLPSILRMERSLLEGIDFIAGVSTALDFLRSLSLHLERVYGEEDQKKWTGLACLLLDVVLFEAPLRYRYPQIILAASVLCLSLAWHDAPSQASDLIFDDVAEYCEDFHSAGAGVIIMCAEEVRQLWKSCAITKGSWAHHFLQVCGKCTPHVAAAAQQPLESISELPCLHRFINTVGKLEAAGVPSSLMVEKLIANDVPMYGCGITCSGKENAQDLSAKVHFERSAQNRSLFVAQV